MTRNNNISKIRPFTGKGFDGRGRSWEEVDAIVKKMRQPAKYEIQQNILGYIQDNNISDQDLKRILEIKSTKRLECLLFAHIENFSLDELGEYASKLLGDFELKIVRPGEEVHPISQPKTNGRVRKHL
ncbi:2461_t:CDS:2 [Funneliformis geosporum]|nr:2461_t:CDS:2 [Funneliformis geosporum]